ncbi:ABC transporter ATP-binding protein [Fusobacterium sp. MFO224]|uniref:ABC transporter ATP-binding protein n=1 Tax=Fusobacterium sp. MFO224 TaxID=3378070 RepID=UPI0038543942
MKTKNLILKYYKKEKKLLTIFIIFNIMVTTLDLTAPLVVKNIIDVAIPKKNLNMIFYLSILVLFIYGIRTFFAIISFSRGQLMGNRIKYHMRNDLFHHMLKQSTEFFNKKEKGELIARLTSDLENSSSLLYRGLQDLMSAGGALIGSFCLMFFFSPILTLIIFLPFPFGFIFVYSKNKKLKKGYKEIRKMNSKFTSTAYELFRVILFLKDNVLENYANNNFKKSNNALLIAEKKNYLNVGIFMAGVTFYVHLTQIILIGFGGYLFVTNKITLGIIISFLLLVDRFKISLIKLAGLADSYQKGMSGINRLKNMLETENSLSEGTEKISLPFKNIQFNNVSFSYGNETILKNISFNIIAKEKIAIIGKSGIGKSTILNLIKKNYLPTSGNISINNIDYQKINKKYLLNMMGILDNSENILYDTVKKNISVVKNKSNHEDIVEASKKAYINDTIERLPNKYETILGNQGITLSTGQNQRISFARLFLKKPDIILLDEATSGLDSISEKIVINNILETLKDKTVIFVTHRLDIIKNFDRILVFNEFGIVEDGNFEKLIKNHGEFYNLYQKNKELAK